VMVRSKLLVLAGWIVAASISTGCAEDDGQGLPRVGCNDLDGVAITINPEAIPTPASGAVTVTGTVSGADCVVQGVTIEGAFSATALAPNFAQWSASIPLSALGVSTCVPAPSEQRSIVAGKLSAQALVLPAQGSPVKVAPPKAADPTCVHAATPNYAGCAAEKCVSGETGDVDCVLPLQGAGSARLYLRTEQSALSRPVVWRSANAIVGVTGESPVVGASEDDAPLCGCEMDPTACKDDGLGTAVIAGGMGAGVDVVTALVDADPVPVGSWTIAVQGPPKLVVELPSIAPGEKTRVELQNPYRLKQKCTFGLPAGVTSNVESGEFTNATETFTITADKTAAKSTASVSCVDDFGQATVVAVAIAPVSED